MWPEIENANSENKRELSLKGDLVSKKIQENGLDPALFTLNCLNFLSINETCLVAVDDDIAKLRNLQSLLLYGNKIADIPITLAELKQLKVLDFSRNEITRIPSEIVNLERISSINLSGNKLTSFPTFLKSSLQILDLSNNCLTNFPDVCYPGMCLLAEIHLSRNKIDEIPDEVIELASLKNLDMSINLVKCVPKALANVTKLKEINLKENPISDKRLLKLVQQCRSKQVLDYVKINGNVRTKSSQQITKVDINPVDEVVKAEVIKVTNNIIKIERHTDDTIKVQYFEEVKAVRQYILCCVVKNVNLTDSNLRKFLQIQSRLHDTVCQKREGATIATHDLNKIKGNLQYTAIDPQKLFITPLGQSSQLTGAHLYNKLKVEAETLRKDKKRNVYSGIHRYLYLLEGKDRFACMTNLTDEVISIPPLTNSEITKMTVNTTNLFVEVTSSASLSACRLAMEALLKETLLLGIGDAPDELPSNYHNLTIQQVKIVDLDGNLKNVYPSRTDLTFDDNIVIDRE